jgi:hypothetical protein
MAYCCFENSKEKERVLLVGNCKVTEHVESKQNKDQKEFYVKILDCLQLM